MRYHGSAYSQAGYASLSDGRVHETTITKLLPKTLSHLNKKYFDMIHVPSMH